MKTINTEQYRDYDLTQTEKDAAVKFLELLNMHILELRDISSIGIQCCGSDTIISTACLIPAGWVQGARHITSARYLYEETLATAKGLPIFKNDAKTSAAILCAIINLYPEYLEGVKNVYCWPREGDPAFVIQVLK